MTVDAGCAMLHILWHASHLRRRTWLSVEQRSEGGPGLPSISIALEAPCTGLEGGPADEGTRGHERFVDASNETISKSAASTKNVIGRLLRHLYRFEHRNG